MDEQVGDPIWTDILVAVCQGPALPHNNQRATLLAYWRRTPEFAHAKRCVIAHYLADLHSNPFDALGWNRAAMDAYRGIQSGDLAPIGIDDPTVFEPSLHLNLGNDYYALGRFADAVAHARAAEGVGQPATTSLAAMIRRGAIALRERAELALNEQRERRE